MNRVLIYNFNDRALVRAWELQTENHFECQLLNRFYDVEREDVVQTDMRLERHPVAAHVSVGLDMKILEMAAGVLVVVNSQLTWDLGCMVYHAFNLRARKEAQGHHLHYPIEVIDMRGLGDEDSWLKFMADKIFRDFGTYEEYLSKLP
jgi:hypothetical protein